MTQMSAEEGKPMDEADPQIIAIQSALPQLASVLKAEF